MPLTSTRPASLALLALVCFACGDEKAALDDVNASDGDATTGASTGAIEPTTGEPEPEPEPEPFVPHPVRGGLEIEWVEANQGVGVAIGRDGAGVDGPERTSYVIQKRLTLIRAFWKELPADWAPRKIEGRLTIRYPDGTELVQSSKALVDGSAFVGNLDRSFYWGLMSEQVLPGIAFNVELYEIEPGHEDLAEGVNPPRLPYTGDALVGVENSDQVMKVTIVPFNYDSEGCKTSPDTSEATMKEFHDKMFMMNPLDTLEITMHEPIDWAEPLTDFNQLNSYMSKLRADEGAEPERYYYGLVDACSGGLGGAGGKAFGIPQGGKAADAWQRVSSGLSLPKNVEFSSDTFVHEVGHSQGRYHVACSGGEGGPDGSYPWPKGEIHDWGFGVINYRLYHPSVNRDYMTYCQPVWSSSWGWTKVYPVIRALSKLDDDAGAPAPDPAAFGALMVGSLYPDGHTDWFTTPGSVQPEQLSAIHGVEFEIDGQPVQQPAAFLPQPEGDVVLIAAPLPARWDEVTKITRLAGPERFTVAREAVEEHHRRGLTPGAQ